LCNTDYQDFGKFNSLRNILTIIRSTMSLSSWGFGVIRTITYMEPHIPNIKSIDAVLDIYPEENIPKGLTHQRHGNGPLTRVL